MCEKAQKLSGQEDAYIVEQVYNAITTAIECLEILVGIAGLFNEAGQLTRERMKEIEQTTQNVYRLLERATYRSRKDLRKPEHQDHPLTLLWHRWYACSEKVSLLVDTFLQSA